MFNTHWVRALSLIICAAGLLGVSSKSIAAPTPISVGIYCVSQGHQRLECQAAVSGGTGSYTYQWTPGPLPVGNGQDHVLVRCGPPYTNVTVSLTVTDSNGATGSGETGAFCGDAQ